MNNFFKKNEKYTTISLYVILTSLIVVLSSRLITNLSFIGNFFQKYNSVFSPFVSGLVIAFLCNPIMAFSEKKIFRFSKKHYFLYRCKRAFSILFTLLVLSLILTVIFMMVVPTVMSSYKDFESQISSYISSAQIWIDDFIKHSFLFDGRYSGLNDLLSATGISSELSNMISSFSSLFTKIISFIFDYAGKIVIQMKNLLIGIFLAIYFLAAKEKLSAQCKKILYSLFNRRTYLNVINLARYTNRAFTGFIVGKILDSAIIALLSFIVLAIFRMPYYPLLSIIIGITNIIPVFGPFIGAIPCAFIILIADPPKTIWFILIIIIIQQLDGNVIGPKILGNTTGLDALWVLISIVIFSGFFGLPGMILGVPLMAVIYAVITELINKKLKQKNKPSATSFYLTDPPDIDFDQHGIFYDKSEVVEEITETAPDSEETQKLKDVVQSELKHFLEKIPKKKKNQK